MNVRDIIVAAANQYGIPVDYALATAQRESGFNPRAKNPNSSASGLFQFINGTWKDYGRGDVFDPYANADAFGRYTQNSAKLLSNAGYDASAGNLYLAHFLGAGGALNALKAPDTAYVRDIMPDVASANPHTKNMTFAELRNWAATKAGGDIKMAELTDKKLSDNEKISADLWNTAKQEGRDPEPQAVPEPSLTAYTDAMSNMFDPSSQGYMSRRLLGIEA
jgi:hypothetical protein